METENQPAEEENKIRGFVYRKRLLFDNTSGIVDFAELKCENGNLATVSCLPRGDNKNGGKTEGADDTLDKPRFRFKKCTEGKLLGQFGKKYQELKKITAQNIDELSASRLSLNNATAKDDCSPIRDRPPATGIFKYKKIMIVAADSNNDEFEAKQKFPKQKSQEKENAKKSEKEDNSNDKHQNNIPDLLNGYTEAQNGQDRDNAAEINGNELHDDKKQNCAEIDKMAAESFGESLTEEDYYSIEKAYRKSFQDKVATFEKFAGKSHVTPLYMTENGDVNANTINDDVDDICAEYDMADIMPSSQNDEKAQTHRYVKKKNLRYAEETISKTGQIHRMNLNRSKSLPMLNEVGTSGDDDLIMTSSNDAHAQQQKTDKSALASGKMAKLKLMKSTHDITQWEASAESLEDFEEDAIDDDSADDEDVELPGGGRTWSNHRLASANMSKSNWAAMFSRRLQHIRQKFENGCRSERANAVRQKFTKSLKKASIGKKLGKRLLQHKNKAYDVGEEDGDGVACLGERNGRLENGRCDVNGEEGKHSDFIFPYVMRDYSTKSVY